MTGNEKVAFDNTQNHDNTGLQDSEIENLFKSLVKQKAYQTIIDEMKANRQTIKYQIYGCKAIAILAAKGDSTIESLVKVGACQVILRAMKAFPASPEVQRRAGDAISKIALTEEIRRLFGELGACHLLVDACALCKSSNNAIKHLCIGMVQLAHRNNTNRTKLGQAGACPNLIEILQEYPEDREIQINALQLVASLAFDPSNDNIFWDANIAEIIPNNLRIHSLDQEVQYYGLRAIYELVISAPGAESNNSSSSEKKTQGGTSQKKKKSPSPRSLKLERNSKQAASSFCEIVIQAMRALPDDENVQLMGLKCIKQLAYIHINNKACLGEHGAGEVVSVALRRFHLHEQVALFGFWAIMNLSCEPGGEYNRVFFRTARIWDLIVEIMQNIPGNAKIQFYGIRSLINLVQSLKADEIKSHLPLHNVSSLVNIAMKNFPEDEGIQSRGCWLLYNLCQDDEDKLILYETKTCENVAQALYNFPNDENVQHRACTVIYAMAKGRLDIGEAYRNLNTKEMITHNMKSNNFDVKVKFWGRKALDAIAERNVS